MENTNDRNSIVIDQDNYKYRIVAAAALIPRSRPGPHAGEWETIVTIYRTSNDERPQAQSFHDHPHQYGATEDEARSKAHDYGRKLVLGVIEGLKI